MAIRRATITDIASRASVSKSTVSHVINGTRFVAEETKTQVLQAIKELNYRPSHIARSLSAQQTRTVGLLISDIGNPFYHHIVQGVEDSALANGYNVFLFNANYDIERSLMYLRSMVERRVDGVLLMSSRMSEALLQLLKEEGVPALVLDWQIPKMFDVSILTFDFEPGIRQAVDHLIALGHENFAHVSGDLDLWTARVRHNLFRTILAEKGVPAKNVSVVPGNFRIDGGRQALRQLLSLPKLPTGIFTVNDLTAIGMIFEAQTLGLRVPDSFSVIGVDDISLSQEISPALTTISVPRYYTGQTAMQMLLDHTSHHNTEAVHRVITPHLVVRGSTAVPIA